MGWSGQNGVGNRQSHGQPGPERGVMLGSSLLGKCDSLPIPSLGLDCPLGGTAIISIKNTLPLSSPCVSSSMGMHLGADFDISLPYASEHLFLVVNVK